MTARVISTYYADPPGRGHCNILMDFKEEQLFIEYFDDHGKLFFSEEFPGKSMRYVEDAAENWALGIKQLN